MIPRVAGLGTAAWGVRVHPAATTVPTVRAAGTSPVGDTGGLPPAPGRGALPVALGQGRVVRQSLERVMWVMSTHAVIVVSILARAYTAVRAVGSGAGHRARVAAVGTGSVVPSAVSPAATIRYTVIVARQAVVHEVGTHFTPVI